MNQGISQIVSIIIAAIVIIGGGILVYQGVDEEEVVGPSGEEIMEEGEDIEEPVDQPEETQTPRAVEEEPTPPTPTPEVTPSEEPIETTPSRPPPPVEPETPEESTPEVPVTPEPEETTQPAPEPIEPEVTTPVPQAETAYVINEIGGTISAIDVATETVVNTVKIAEGGGALSGLHTIVASPDKTHFYISDHRADTVLFVRVSDLSVVAETPVDEAPNGLAVTPDGKKLYVANFDSDTVSVINTATHEVVSSISVDRSPSDVTVTPDGAFVYVTHFYDAANDVTRMLIIDTDTDTLTGEEVSLPSSSRSRETVFTPDGTRGYVSVERTDAVSIIDVVNNTVIKTLSGMLHVGHMIMSRNGKFVYVVAEIDRKGGTVLEPKVYAINTETEKLSRQMSGFKSPRGIAETADGAKLYVTDYKDDEIRIFDLDLDAVVTKVSVGDAPLDIVIIPGS